MGVEETLSNGGWFLALITVVEIIVIWHIIIKNYQHFTVTAVIWVFSHSTNSLKNVSNRLFYNFFC